jgi:Nif-specific regulatory protein
VTIKNEQFDQEHADGGAARFALLYEVSRSFSERLHLDELLPLIVAKTKELFGVESSAILLLDEERDELFFPYVSDVDAEVEQRFSRIRFAAGQGIAGWVVRHGEPQLVNDVSQDERWFSGVDRGSGMVTHSLLCAPLRTRRGVVGVIELRNKRSGEFCADDLSFLDALTGSIAVAIENARLYQTLKASEAHLRDEVVALNRELARHSRFSDLVGTSPAMQRVFQLMESAITTPVTVLIQGETGTGKELIARAIHFHGTRKERPFVAVNCAGVPETLLESELFGHRRGSFTGAITDRKGLFEVADGGTVFLDEIGETPPAMQAKLLRVLQSGEVLPVGASTPTFVDARVISATNRDLEEETKRGRFRQDLYYRLNAFPITVPALRERADDIPLLAAHLLQRVAQRFEKPVRGFSPAALGTLTRYPWPGNVRELENEIERAVALVGGDDAILPKHLSDRLRLKPGPPRVAPATKAVRLREARDAFEAEYIAEILHQNGGNASRTAKLLGLSRVMLQRKIKQFGLRRENLRPASP